MAQLADGDFTRSTGSFEVVLLQGNVSQDSKFDINRGGPALNWHHSELTRQQADLAVAPETAVPVLEQDLPAVYWSHLRQRGGGHEAGVLLIGMPHCAGPQGLYNAPCAPAVGVCRWWRP